MEATEKRSNALAGTGVGLGAGALGWLLLQSGALGNVFGNRAPSGDPPWARDLGYERQLTSKDAEIGKLQAQLYTDQQVNALRQELQAGAAAQAVINAQQTGAIGILQTQMNVFNSMTSPYIKQPVMAASEAALAAFTAKSSASTTQGAAA